MFIRCTIYFTIFQCFILIITSVVVQNLRRDWILTNTLRGYNLKATVPGGIYTDLMKNNVIDDVFYERNDVQSRWIAKENWNYTTFFSVDDNVLSHRNIQLVFHGIDTFSKIYLNEVQLGTTENMFVRYTFNVKPFVKLGNNSLRVQLESPVIAARALFRKQLQHYLVPPMCVPADYNGECHVNHIRKMQASFGWDWGPALPSMGIWKDVFLKAYHSTLLTDICTIITFNGNKNVWNIELHIFFEDNSQNLVRGELKLQLTTNIMEIVEIYKIHIKQDAEGDFVYKHNVSVPKSYINLWWPNGYGEAALYKLKVTFLNFDKTEESKKVVKIGFRTVELVQNVLENGTTFYFKVNNHPIFIKGSNIIPLNILPELGYNLTQIRFLLQSSKDVHANMLRVWGGGVYESNAFYDTADELGLLIWQDFMFACSMYPITKEFLKNVRIEVKQQVQRLQYHPSIAIWAANNENEVALSQNWYRTQDNFSLYKKDFETLYVDTIKKQVILQDSTRPFLTSSPTNGIESENEGYVAKNAQSNLFGDVHFYNYLVDGTETSVYPISRFVSEYGYQSLPCIETLLMATNTSANLMIYDDFLKHRQHHQFGFIEMDLLISYQLKLPNERSINFYKAFIFYSQVIQAMSIKTATEFYRRWRSNINDIGEGLNMGAMYWQLNDVWAAPSWSSIDFAGNWKVLHYFAKSFFAPVIVTTVVSVTKDMSIFVISDLMKIVRNTILKLSIYKWDSTVPVHEISIKVDVLPGFAQKVYGYSLTTLLSEIKNSPCGKSALNNCFVYFTLTGENRKRVSPDNFLFPTSLKTSNLVIPNLKIANVTQVDAIGKHFEIEVCTDVVTLFVWLEVKAVHGIFSDNGFLQVTAHKVIDFFPVLAVNIDTLIKSLTVTHLLDKQYF
ncbi:hypothetical protein FQA39_LY10710 [Lamprigera yunnana]|nr:hypothetical protein FQA39_LY10710 [Lamprigera yunnana]